MFQIAGHGVRAVIDGTKTLAGNAKLMEREHIRYAPSSSVGTVVYLVCNGKYAGCIVIEDEIKADAAVAIKNLKSSGIRRTVMLTGDADAVGKKWPDASVWTNSNDRLFHKTKNAPFSYMADGAFHL